MDIKPLSYRTDIPNVDQMISILVEMYQKINDTHIDYVDPAESFSLPSLFPDVVISEKTKNIINTMAKTLKIELSDDFYDVKGIMERPAFYSTGYGNTIVGDEKAKEKYFLIKKLETRIKKYGLFSAYGHLIEDIQFVALVICNDGDTYDKDIWIDVYFPKDCIYSVSDIRGLEFQEVDFLMNEMELVSLMNIERTVEFLDYAESYTHVHPKAVSYRMDGPFGHTTTKEELINDFENAIDYYVEESDENVVVEIKFDKVLHNTAIAFPQIILLKKATDKISYTIKSSNNPKVLKGEIAVELK